MTAGGLHIVFAPFPSAAALEIMAVVAAVFVLFAFLRRARGTAGRAFLLALVLLALANPSLIADQREPLKDIAVIAVDDSASMQVGERAAQIETALDALTRKLSGLADIDTEIVHVKGRERTDLFHAIAQKLGTLPRDRLAGVIALTDGEVHDQPSGLTDVPFHALIAGHHDEIDRRLIVKQAPAYGIVGHKVGVVLRIEDEPEAQSGSALVTITHDNGETRTVSMPVNKDVNFELPVDHAGTNLTAFSTEALTQEITPLNNTAIVSVNGIRDRLRVLLVSGQPHIGGRTWRNFLKADPAVDLIHFTILRSPLKQDSVPSNELALIAFPVHELFEVKLKSFDLVILDRFRDQSLVPDSYLANIARYVEDGGALLVSNATDEAMPAISMSPLARILPATPTGQLLTGSFVPDLTPPGARHPVTASLSSDMPHDRWGPWFRQIGGHASRGDVLMSGKDGQPLLVLDRVGKGRVAQFLSDQFWLWAREGDGPQAELLRRVAHWLVQEPELDETALRAHADMTDAGWNFVIEKQSLHETSDDVTVADPRGQIIPAHLAEGAQPGILTATLPVTQPGLYHIKDGDRDILAMVGASDAPEYGAMRATADILQPVAKASGGGLNWLADDPEGPKLRRVSAGSSLSGWDWIGLRRNGQYRVTGSQAYPLMPPWAAAALLLAVALWMWRREGR